MGDSASEFLDYILNDRVRRVVKRNNKNREVQQSGYRYYDYGYQCYENRPHIVNQ